MGTLNLALTGLQPTDGLPGQYVEVRVAQGEIGGDLSTPKLLIMATSTSAGSIVQDTEVAGPFSDEADVITKCGTGSRAHRLFRAFIAVCKSLQVFIVCPTRSAGVAASATVTFATAPNGTGVAQVELFGVVCAYTYTASDTVTTIAAGLRDAINAHPEFPVTATSAAGVLTITAKDPGPDGNFINFIASVSTGTALTVSPTVETNLASGATAPDFTNALGAITGQRYDRILVGTTDATAIGLVKTFVDTQALPISGKRMQLIAGLAASPSAATTLAQGLNAARDCIINLRASREEPDVVAAKVAGARANLEFGDPASNFDGYGLGEGDVFPVMAPRSKANWFNTTELRAMLAAGVTPIGINDAGVPYIVRLISTRSYLGSTSAVDYRARDIHRVTVADKFGNDAAARIAGRGWKKICDDPPANSNKQPDALFNTPSRTKTLVEQLISDYCDAGWLDPARKQEIIAALAVGLDPGNATRMNLRSPIFAANLFHQSWHLVAESSAAA